MADDNNTVMATARLRQRYNSSAVPYYAGGGRCINAE